MEHHTTPAAYRIEVRARSGKLLAWAVRLDSGRGWEVAHIDGRQIALDTTVEAVLSMLHMVDDSQLQAGVALYGAGSDEYRRERIPAQDGTGRPWRGARTNLDDDEEV